MFREIARQRISLVTTNLVLAEVHRQLLFRAGIRAAAAAIQAIERASLLSIEFVGAAHHASALDWIRRFDDQPLTYTDAVGFAVMSAKACRQFIGFDRHFVVAGYQRWLPKS